MEEDRRQLQNLLTKVTRAATSLAAAPSYVPLPNAGEKFSSRKGRLPWPTQGRIAHGFGSSQIEGQMQVWNGILISASAGQPVKAVHYGRVIFADYFRGQGLLVIVDHGEGYLSLYAHNQHLLKKSRRCRQRRRNHCNGWQTPAVKVKLACILKFAMRARPLILPFG